MAKKYVRHARTRISGRNFDPENSSHRTAFSVPSGFPGFVVEMSRDVYEWTEDITRHMESLITDTTVPAPIRYSALHAWMELAFKHGILRVRVLSPAGFVPYSRRTLSELRKLIAERLSTPSSKKLKLATKKKSSSRGQPRLQSRFRKLSRKPKSS